MSTDVTFVTNIDLSTNELRNAKFHVLATAPTAIEGRFYYNSATKQFLYYNGTAWVAGSSLTVANLSGQASAFGQAASNGSAATAARSDHYHALPAHDAAAHSAISISALAVPTADVPWNSKKITGLANGTAAGDAVNKSQLDGKANTVHTHPISDVTNLQTSLDAKVTGPASATDNRVARFDGATGKLIQNSPMSVDDAGGVTGVNDMQMTGFLKVGTIYGATGQGATAFYFDGNDWVLPQQSKLGYDFNADGNRLTNLADGFLATDAVTKQQLDAAVSAAAAGLDVKQSARVYSTGLGIGTYNNTGGAKGRGQITAAPNTMDGVSLVAGNRILVGSGATSGIWVVTTVGTGANGVWDRATDFDDDAEVTANAFVFVEEGTTYADTGWVLTTNNPITIGGPSGTSLTWTQFSGSGTIAAGAGLYATGNALSVGGGNGIEVLADEIQIDSSIVVAKYKQTLTTSATSYVIPHGLGTRDVHVSIRQIASPYGNVITAWEATTTTTVTLYFATAPAANTLSVVVMG